MYTARILKVGEIMEFLYCDSILYQYCPNVYKKIILHFFMLFGVVNLFDWWYVSQKKSTKVTERIQKN